MYSFPNLEPVCCFMSGSNCCFLTCIQISQEAGKVIWYSHLLKNFPQFVVIYTVKGFAISNKAEVDVFSGILLLSLWSSRCWQFDLWEVHSSHTVEAWLENFDHYFASVWDECNCAVVWTFFPGGLDSKVSVYNAGDLCSIPWLGRSPGEGNGNTLQYCCLENPMDRGAW